MQGLLIKTLRRSFEEIRRSLKEMDYKHQKHESQVDSQKTEAVDDLNPSTKPERTNPLADNKIEKASKTRRMG